jgi:hypothetical protein
MNSQTSTIVPFHTLRVLDLRGVTEKDIETLFYERDPADIPRVLYENNNAIVYCSTHDIAKSMFEWLDNKYYNVDWHLEENEEMDSEALAAFYKELEDNHWEEYYNRIEEERERWCPRHCGGERYGCMECYYERR